MVDQRHTALGDVLRSLDKNSFLRFLRMISVKEEGPFEGSTLTWDQWHDNKILGILGSKEQNRSYYDDVVLRAVPSTKAGQSLLVYLLSLDDRQLLSFYRDVLNKYGVVLYTGARHAYAIEILDAERTNPAAWQAALMRASISSSEQPDPNQDSSQQEQSETLPSIDDGSIPVSPTLSPKDARTHAKGMTKNIETVKDLFLSHSHADKPFVRKISKDLEQQGISVWLDEAELLIGDSLIQKIGQAIDQTRFFAAVVSSNSVDSEWVKTELEQALETEISSKTVKVLPLVLGSVDRLPAFLRAKLYADFSGWPDDHGQYEDSLRNLVRSVSKRKSTQ